VTAGNGRLSALGGEVAVGIDDPDSLAGLEVLGHEIAKEGTLAGAGLADEVQVVPAIATGKASVGFVEEGARLES
jgi:hypothetical protein